MPGLSGKKASARAAPTRRRSLKSPHSGRGLPRRRDKDGRNRVKYGTFSCICLKIPVITDANRILNARLNCLSEIHHKTFIKTSIFTLHGRSRELSHLYAPGAGNYHIYTPRSVYHEQGVINCYSLQGFHAFSAGWGNEG